MLSSLSVYIDKKTSANILEVLHVLIIIVLENKNNIVSKIFRKFSRIITVVGT